MTTIKECVHARVRVCNNYSRLWPCIKTALVLSVSSSLERWTTMTDLSLPPCLPPSFSLTTPHYTGVHPRCKGYDESSAFCRCLAAALTPVNASSVSAPAVCAPDRSQAPPGHQRSRKCVPPSLAHCGPFRFDTCIVVGLISSTLSLKMTVKQGSLPLSPTVCGAALKRWIDSPGWFLC